MHYLSKSVLIMFIFDLLFLCVSTIYWCNYFFKTIEYMLLATIFVTVTGILSLFLKGNYKIREFNITFYNAYRLLEGVIFAHIPYIFIVFLFVSKRLVMKFILFNIATIGILLYIYRLGFHFYLFNLKKVKKVLIVGANERAKTIIDVINNKKALQMEVIGIVKSAEAEKNIAELSLKIYKFKLSKSEINNVNTDIETEKQFNNNTIRIYQDAKNLHNIIQETKADIVIFTKKLSLVSVLPSNIQCYLMTDFYEMATNKFYIDDETLTDLTYNFIKYPKEIYAIWKNRFDKLCALIILTVTLPITIFIAIKVKLADGKSPFYAQERVGKNGEIFNAYKLRTMYDNDFVPSKDKQVGYVKNEFDDDRIIKGCKFVRKARFDEIPQMINIIKGEMSMVGPRAEWVEMANIYKTQIKGYEKRTLIPTAWTGWAQINQGHCVSVDDIIEKLQYDLYYIKHRNLLWDFAILIKAIFLACGGRHK